MKKQNFSPASALDPRPLSLDLLSFHLTLFARPDDVRSDDCSEIDGQSFATLSLRANQLSTPFDVTFEQAEAALAELPRMFCEPDGSFVWRSSDAAQPWQVDGQLTDRSDRLLSAELKGTCPRAEFDELLSKIGWPATPLVFQLAQAGVHLAETEFRRWAELREDR